MAHGTRSKTDSMLPKANADQLATKEMLTSFLSAKTDSTNLSEFTKEELINLVLKLRNENSTLKDDKAFIERTNKRLENLEREQNLSLQYNRRDSVEITGIPGNIENADLEDEVIKVFNKAKVVVNGVKLDKAQFQGCHRVGEKGKVILKTLNRKYAVESLYCSKNLKGNSPYDNPVFISNSFCKEFGRLNYLVRKAKKDNIINRWKIKHGVTFVKLVEDGELLEISHFNDLVNYGIVTD